MFLDGRLPRRVWRGGLVIEAESIQLEFGVLRRKQVLIRRFRDKHQRFVQFVVMVVEIPELLLGLPPFHDSTEAGDCQQNLNVPVPTMPIWMVVPGLSNVLHALYNPFTKLGLGHELRNRHFGHIGCDCNYFIQRSHDGVDRIIHKYL